jgi:hypothetical protein
VHTLGDVADTATHVVSDLVGDVAPLVSDVTSTVTTVADLTVHALGDVAGTATHAVVGPVGDAPLASDLTVTTIADATVHTLGDAAISNLIGDAPQTVTSLADSVIHSVTASASLDTLTSPVTSLLDHDGSAASTVASAADTTSDLNDLLGNTLHSLGVSSPGSLSFAAETPDTFASHDAVASSSGYSQFNLAVSDTSQDTGVSAPTSTDTGGITTIVASAIGIGSHATNTTSDSGDHASDTQPVHLPVLDDLHSHLHLGLFG